MAGTAGSRKFTAGGKIVAATASLTNFEYNQTFSGACWAYVIGSGAFYEYFGHLDPATSFRGWEMLHHVSSSAPANKPYVQIINNSSTHLILRPFNTALTGTETNIWVHLGFSYDGSHTLAGTHVYFNGVLDDTGTNAIDTLGTNTIQNSIPLVIGERTDNSIPMQGNLADVAVWNVVLTAGEFAALHNGVRPPYIRPGTLVSYWPINGIQSPEPDLSGNANNGTVTSTTIGTAPPTTLLTPSRLR